MNYSAIKTEDIANGEGVRVSLFVSGCRNHCPGCFNSETWDFNYGNEYTNETTLEILNLLNRPFISGLSILGGDPFEPENIRTVCSLCSLAKQSHKDKDIWLYTGYKWEDFKDDPIMNYIDVLVDGKYDCNKRDISLAFKGSSNQRVIDVKKSMEANSVIQYKNY